jgi:hypothetical protein
MHSRLGSARSWARRAAGAVAICAVIGGSSPARAIPAFARKYGTSCLTCHTVYPKLNPFGEAFRRNGYRFPGHDSDFVKQDTIALGQEAQRSMWPNAVWPGTLPGSVPIAVGFNGQALIHPDKTATAAQADNGTQFTLRNLIAEGHIWAGGTYDDHTSFFSELTFADGSASVEKAKVIIGDWLGPLHAVNLVVGRDAATLTSFGSKSTYLADTPLVSVAATALFGATTSSFNIGDNENGVELNGVVGGRFDYSVGLNAGANLDVRPTENFYGHVGAKLGGLRLDGEGSAGPDPTRPWAETAFTADVFAYRSNSRFTDAAAGTQQDSATTLGAGFRAQAGSLELNSGGYREKHNHVQPDGSGVLLYAQYNELSYVLYPWLVPAVRFEWVKLQPEVGPGAYDARVIPGAAILFRPNLKFVVTGQFEKTDAAPPGGWGPANGLAVPTDKPTGIEIEAINVALFTAW